MISLLDLVAIQKVRADFIKRQKKLAYRKKNIEVVRVWEARARAKKKASR
jgi:hypothetical protein